MSNLDWFVLIFTLVSIVVYGVWKTKGATDLKSYLKGNNDAKDIIYKIDEIPGVSRTETMIALEESINDKKRMMHAIFKEL